MLRSVFSVLIAFAFAWVATAAEQGEIVKLQGKWEAKRNSEDGEKGTQTLDIKKDKILYKILNDDGQTVFMATAEMKPQKAGAFQTFTITNIKAGSSEDSLEASDEDRSYVYQLTGQTLTIVSNIDQERERPPVLDVYKKVNISK